MKFFGILDILAGLVIILLKFGFLQNVGLLLAVYLGMKGLFFINNLASIVDFVTAVFLLLAAVDIYFSFTWLFSLWLFQKGIFSLMS
jgi:hypothetical protein